MRSPGQGESASKLCHAGDKACPLGHAGLTGLLQGVPAEWRRLPILPFFVVVIPPGRLALLEEVARFARRGIANSSRSLSIWGRRGSAGGKGEGSGACEAGVPLGGQGGAHMGSRIRGIREYGVWAGARQSPQPVGPSATRSLRVLLVCVAWARRVPCPGVLLGDSSTGVHWLRSVL